MNINKYLQFDISHKNKHKVVTLGYACAITFAFVLSLANNNDVNASVSSNERFDYMMLEASVADNLSDPETIYPESSIDNIKTLFNKVTTYRRDVVREQEVVVAKGDTFLSLLTDLGMDYNAAHDIYLKLSKVYKPTNLRIGQHIKIKGKFDTQTEQILSLEHVVIEPKAGQRFVVSLDKNSQYVARSEKDELVEEINSASGTINGALSSAMKAKGVPGRVSGEFIRIFNGAVDFRRDVHRGDKFEIVYENHLTPNGEVVKTGNVLYAALIIRNTRIARYRFETSAGEVAYYDEKGSAGKKTLSRKPLEYQNARISSPFGKRRHPILRDLRIHWGVDYAAPRGSKIFAGGDGVIQESRYNGAYGNYIKIRHNASLSTAYGHMSGFAKGIRPGVRVKQGQVIGYVGTTGRSTGPHLHYEVVQNGKRVNPRTIAASAGENLAGRQMQKFKAKVADIQRTYKSMFAQNDPKKVASK